MGKKVLTTLQNWDEVNEAMKKLGELNIEKQKLEGEQTIQINEIKAHAANVAGVLNDEIKKIEKDIERFAEANKEAFAKTRNKKLNFGRIAFKVTKSVSCSANFVNSAIKVLKSFGLDNCIRIKEELNKDAIKDLDKDAQVVSILTKAGITIKTADKITIEPDYIKLANYKE